MVGRSDVDVHTYKSIHFPKYCDGLEGVSLYLKSSFGIPSLKGVPDNIGTSMRRSSGRRSGVAVRAVDCWQ